jgi:glucose dehydrogenase
MSKTLFETRPDNKKNFGYGKMTKECDEKGNNAFTTMLCSSRFHGTQKELPLPM